MRLHRFYVNKPIEYSRFEVNEERLIHQWRDVFRYNVGSEVILFDGSGMEYDCLIEKITRMEAVLSVCRERKGIVPEREVILCQSIIKKDKMEWVAEKATELGVSKIVPVIAERGEKKNIDLERLKKIVIEAAEQCGRADVPVLESIKELVESIKEAEGEIIVLDPSGSLFPSSLITTNHSPLYLFIGPEGGWTSQEIQRFKDLNIERLKEGKSEIKIFSLGNLTLRAETAAIAALATLTLLD